VDPVEALPTYTSGELMVISGKVARNLSERGVRVTIPQVRAVIEEAWPYVVTPALVDHTPRELGSETICDWCGTRWPCDTAAGAGVV
jgi:hypothetical protein